MGFAQQFGIQGMRIGGHVPNTRRALAVTEYARQAGKLHRFREAAMSAFWREERDIEADDTLGALARAVGLDETEAVSAASSTEYLDRVDRLRQQAQQRGVHAIPAFFFGDHPAPLVGCQPFERLAAVAEQAGATKLVAGSD